MARTFNGTTQTIGNLSGSWVFPLTMAARVFTPANETAGNTRSICGLRDVANGEEVFIDIVSSAGTAWRGRAAAKNSSSTFNIATGTNNLTASAYNYVVGVFTSTSSRTVYSNTTTGVSETTANTSSGWDVFRIGQRAGGTSTGVGPFWSGPLCDVAIWNVALSVRDVEEFGDRVSPIMIRSSALVNYFPLFGYADPEIDLCSGETMTVTGATQSNQPAIWFPRNPQVAQRPTTVSGKLLKSLQREGLFVGHGL